MHFQLKCDLFDFNIYCLITRLAAFFQLHVYFVVFYLFEEVSCKKYTNIKVFEDHVFYVVDDMSHIKVSVNYMRIFYCNSV